MVDTGALMVGTFGRLLAPILVACHTANHVSVSKKKIDEVMQIINE